MKQWWNHRSKSLSSLIDQQLDKVVINAMWVYLKKFPSFVLRLGGMHMLMSLVGCVGVLMANSCLEQILKSSFSSVVNMLLTLSQA